VKRTTVRERQDAEFKALFDRAHAAGMAAGRACQPTPMTVVEHANPLDDTSPVVRRYAPCLGGVCGFARVTLHPGTGAAARYAKTHLGAGRAYEGGISLWCSEFGQSMEMKEAYCRAYAAVLDAAGLKVYVHSRMD
jgi:hypothetical protein